MGSSPDRTLQYLSLLSRDYEVVVYPVNATGSMNTLLVAKDNPNRVAFYMATGTGNVGFKGGDGLVVPFPSDYDGSRFYWITINQHLILPTLEIYYFDNAAPLNPVKAYGIIKRERG